jgi:hypothetical protein
VLVGDVDVKVVVANDFEECDLAIIGHGPARTAASDRLFDDLDVTCARVRQQVVSSLDWVC